MSPRLPSLSGAQVVRALLRGGFIVVRIKGSHHVIKHPTDATRKTVVPVHGNEDLGRGLVRKIVSDVGLSVDEFLALLRD